MFVLPHFINTCAKWFGLKPRREQQHSVSSVLYKYRRQKVADISLPLRLRCGNNWEIPLQQGKYGKGCIILLYFTFRFFVRPIRTPVGKLRFQLGEDLFMLDSLTIYRLFYFYTEETAAACRVTHQIERLEVPMKEAMRGKSRKLRWYACRRGDSTFGQILQKRHFTLCIFVEFIQIDQPHFWQKTFCLSFWCQLRLSI